MIRKNSKIFLAGHNGMVGSSILRILKKNSFRNIITVDKKKIDLINQASVQKFIKKNKPDCVIIAAAKVGGIFSNLTNKPKFIYENLMIQSNLIHYSYVNGVKDLLFLGSSCVYPAKSKQPIKEESLLSHYPENTNDAYAIAKIAGIKMCEFYSEKYNLNYFSLMPSNMFGPNDNYDLKNSHFFPALIKKIYQAKKKNLDKVELWGDGSPRRELLYVDHFSESCVYFLTIKKKLGGKIINIGSHVEMTIKEYAEYIMKQLKIRLKLTFNKKKPNGVKRKKLDMRFAKSLGWNKKFKMNLAFKKTFEDFILSEKN